MVAEMKPMKPRQVTWVDWSNPDAEQPTDLMTRDELVQALNREGVQVTVRDLAFWQSNGAIPYPLKRRIQGVTQGYYPPWFAELIRELRRLQEDGRKLSEIRPALHALAQNLSRQRHVSAHDQGRMTSTEHAHIQATTGHLSLKGLSAAVSSGSGTLSVSPSVFEPLATAIARAYRERYGTQITEVQIRLIDERGNPMDFSFQTDERLETTG